MNRDNVWIIVKVFQVNVGIVNVQVINQKVVFVRLRHCWRGILRDDLSWLVELSVVEISDIGKIRNGYWVGQRGGDDCIVGVGKEVDVDVVGVTVDVTTGNGSNVGRSFGGGKFVLVVTVTVVAVMAVMTVCDNVVAGGVCSVKCVCRGGVNGGGDDGRVVCRDGKGGVFNGVVWIGGLSVGGWSCVSIEGVCWDVEFCFKFFFIEFS